jgi:hypothetical protein
MKTTMLALGILSSSVLTSGCTTPANCPTCGTTQNGTIVAITSMEVPQSSPFGKPFAVWDLVSQDPVNRRLYVTDRSHAAIAVFDTATDQPIGQLKGGFVGSVCCEPDRASNFNEVSGPNGAIVTPSTTGGKLGNLWVSDGDSTMKIFNLDTDTVVLFKPDGSPVLSPAAPSQAFGTAVTGIPVTDIDACARFGTNCGDMRADEPSFDPEHNKLIVTNGDTPGPGGPIVTLIDTTNPVCAGNSCVQAQFFFDGGGDTVTTGCPGPGASGVARVNGTGPIRCRHVGNNGSNPYATNGLGGSIYNPGTHRFLQSVPQVGPNAGDGEVTEIDPVAYRVTNHFPLKGLGCQAAALALGPINNLLVGCANREGQAFPPSTVIMDATTGAIIKVIYEVGRVDQVWYNSGDKRFYLAARDMENGSFLGIIDATNNMWLYNSPTGGNAHGVAADPVNNHIYIPIGVNARCGRFSAEGCISVYASP